MIRVQVVKKNHRITGFQISGHAGYAAHGQDIVCAAVSFMATSVVNTLERQFGICGDVEVADGYLQYRLPDVLGAETIENAQSVLQVLVTGFQDLKEKYPKNILIQYVKLKGGASE